ncbi:chlorohydrolase family protein [Candidatus Bipolaricaulota bacterium]
MKTLISASYIVAHDGVAHRILRDGVLVWEDDLILHVGSSYEGHVDRRISAEGKLVSPGLINMHALASTSVTMLKVDGPASALSVGKAFAVDGKGSLNLTDQELEVVSRFAWASLLKGGGTTNVAITPMAMSRWESPRKEAEALVRIAGEIGARAYVSHQYRSAVKYVDSEGVLQYEWNEDAGQEGLRHALQFCDKNEGTYNDRVRTMLFPYQFETCSPSLLSATKKIAQTEGYPIHIHVAYSLGEFYESLRRYAKTPIQYLHDTGFLGPSVIATHALYTSYNPLSGFVREDTTDIDLLAESGTTVAHCPVIYSRGARGDGTLRSFAAYRRRGVNVTLGTDTFPMDMIREMRAAAIMGKSADRDPTAVTARDVFEAATTSAAKALGRADLGRLSPGAKADLLVVDLTKLHLGLVDDPIKTMVYMASQSDIESVFVDGKEVVQEGRIPNLDEEDLACKANTINQKQKHVFTAQHPLGIREQDLFPPSYKDWS